MVVRSFIVHHCSFVLPFGPSIRPSMALLPNRSLPNSDTDILSKPQPPQPPFTPAIPTDSHSQRPHHHTTTLPHHHSSTMAASNAVTVKVHFVDGEYENLQVTEDITAGQLRDLFAIKIGMRPADEAEMGPEFRGPECFSIWVCGDDVELELSDEDRPFEFMSGWKNLMRQYSNVLDEPWYRAKQAKRKKGKIKEPPCKIFFRTTALLAKPYERKFPSPGNPWHPAVVDTLWKQAHQWMLNAYYPEAKADDAVELAALYMQIKFGDYNPKLHKVNFVPMKKLIAPRLAKKKKDKEWFKLVQPKHAELAGKDKLICQLLYLQRVRQFKTHNATMFEAVYNYDRESMFEHPFESGVVLGVNADGLFMVDLLKMKYLYFYHWSQVKDWEFTQESFSCVLTESEPGEDGTYEDKTHVFFTYQGELLVELIEAALDDLDAEAERVERTAKAQQKEREKQKWDTIKRGNRRSQLEAAADDIPEL
ncbi:uncharacterized protein AMSG_00310 [Thecamonas trahens ATCC 50062]|uniref:FERM domain-containing protein n=1 Tax=Thecamonas trahens ATCC 50062 TaxID=461836 RepID=A0A0L0D1V8_THETB|nr:hypothetical protein AMSG_00310 [Thecamonas trahens ATCC 50062]KNC46191.1 hypothetical protein AMSG_00310 [Thecamonas trahens ATCC 50062]|eukprot:XP_013763166.1 hypothetical protein AMSG_00310 [Thecamonas trahens ATCC 50062]